ncbi:MAG: PASTA domain-containing protein [Bacteroidaceae bacterium]|nr:PASTA domain-containing protein [Bacteroidaceae bacterium]
MKKFWDFLKNHRIITTLLLMLLVTIILFIGLNIWLNSYTRHNDATQLPSVKYMTVDEATHILQRYNLRYEIIDSIYNEKAAPGIVMDQIPAPDSKVKEGRVIYLTINAFSPRTIKLPHIINSSVRQAKAQLQSLGFRNIEIQYQPSPYKDLVLNVKHDNKTVSGGEQVEATAHIVLVVGKGQSNTNEYVSMSDTLQEEETIVDDSFIF